MFNKIRTVFFVNKLINREINKKYTMKISCSLGSDCDKNSDAKAKKEIADMIMNGSLNKNNIKEICDTYMGTRETIIMLNGGSSRWVHK